MTKVSVVLCTYNGADYLRAQLESIVSQTYPVSEVVLQDDGSTDDTMRIAGEFRLKYPAARFRLYINSRRMGFNRNFFSACMKAEGDLIFCCDQDDVWAPDKVERMVGAMTPDVAFAFHNSVLFDESGELGPLHRRPLPEYATRLCTVLSPRSYGHQIVFRREALSLLQPFATRNLSYDYFLHTLCCSLGRVRYVDRPLVRWRRYRRAATYAPFRKRVPRLRGYFTALGALRNRPCRTTTQRYFELLRRIDFHDADSNRAVAWMSRGTLWGIVCTALLCVRRRRTLFPDAVGLTRMLRAAFLPLCFVRDHGRYILRD